MAPLTLLLAMVPVIATQASTVRAPYWQPYVAEAAGRFALPAEWIERVIAVESGGVAGTRTGPIRSPKGAMGLMQLMPETWAAMRGQLQLGSDPDDPRDNILAGSCYLRMMYDRFGYPGMFAAYNAGPRRYADWLAGRGALPAETRRYVVRLGESLSAMSPRERADPRPLFVTARGTGALDSSPQARSGADLFAIPNRAP